MPANVFYHPTGGEKCQSDVKAEERKETNVEQAEASELHEDPVTKGDEGVHPLPTVGVVDEKPQQKRCSCKCRCRNRKCCGQCSKRYRGIYEKSGRWNAQIQHQGKKYYLGSYSTREEAAKQYDLAALRFHGDNAVVNFNSTEEPKEPKEEPPDEDPSGEDAKDTTNAVSILMSLRDINTSTPPHPAQPEPVSPSILEVKEELPMVLTPAITSGLSISILPAKTPSQLCACYCAFPDHSVHQCFLDATDYEQLRLLDKKPEEAVSPEETDTMKSMKRPNHSKHTKTVLMRWLTHPAHFFNPYPTVVAKRQLALDTNLREDQVANWFVNTRKRFLTPIMSDIRQVLGSERMKGVETKLDLYLLLKELAAAQPKKPCTSWITAFLADDSYGWFD
ncbi:hypothetical protein WA577_004335, partial [Blastocystis sp. JDR]